MNIFDDEYVDVRDNFVFVFISEYDKNLSNSENWNAVRHYYNNIRDSIDHDTVIGMTGGFVH